jgi:hypothetical protein
MTLSTIMFDIGRPVALDSVFRALDDTGISWCLLRPEPSHEKGDDVDLLVSTADRGRIGRLLNDVGFARIPAWGHGSHAFFIGYDAPSDRWIHLDVVSDLAFGPAFALKTAAAADCLRRRQRTEGVWVLNPDDGFWTLLLHNLLDKQAIQVKHRDRLRSLARSARTENPIAGELDALAAPQWRAARLLDRARAGDWETLEALAGDLVSAWMRRRRLDSAIALVEMRVSRRMAQLCSPLLLHGFGVALVSPDSTEKGPVAAGLESSFPVPARRMDMDLSGAWSRAVMARLYHTMGRIIILDRYGFGTPLTIQSKGGLRLARARDWLLARVCPQPRLTLLFDSGRDPVHERKSEARPRTGRRNRRDQGHERAQRETAVVDASGDSTVVHRQLLALIWCAYCRDRRGSATS